MSKPDAMPEGAVRLWRVPNDGALYVDDVAQPGWRGDIERWIALPADAFTTLAAKAARAERAEALLDEASLQIEYLDAKFKATGTSTAIIARIAANRRSRA